MTEAMKAIEIQTGFGIENLTVADRAEPTVGPGQVLLRMKAATLNYRDVLTVQGHYNPRQPLPLIPCSDGVGEVVALAEGVERVSVGERVCPMFCQGWLNGEADKSLMRRTLGGPLDGTLCEFMAVDADSVVRVPDYLSDAEAAALPCAALTAWTALHTLGNLQTDDVVVVQGTGGVSLFALQFAQASGARVIITSSSDEKLTRARQLGAWQTINYRDQASWGKVVKELTEGRGADHVVEVGGAGTLAQSLRAVRPFGRISLIGVLSGGSSELSILPILMQNICVQGVFVGHRESFEHMIGAMAEHQLRPLVSDRFALNDARAAFEHMVSGQHFGKIAITIV